MEIISSLKCHRPLPLKYLRRSKTVSRAYHYLLMIWLLMAAVATSSAAEIYRWVDENGKVHYTDQRSAKGANQTEAINIGSSNSISDQSMPSVKKPKPIINTSQNNGKSIALEYFSIDLEDVPAGENIELGKAYVYTPSAKKLARNLYKDDRSSHQVLACKANGSLKLNNAKYISKKTNFTRAANATLEKYGYASAGSEAKKFALQQNDGVDLSLAAEVVAMRLALCDNGVGGLEKYTQNSTYFKIKWEVFDNLARKIVYKTETEGVDDHIKRPPRLNGAPISMELAFQQAIEHMLSQQEFINIILGETQLSDNSNTKFNRVSANLVYGNNETSFSKKIQRIKAATVTVRTASGHGSGFVISEQGHVLTNQHVVANNQDVLVIIEGEELRAQVLQTDNRRDVALLKLKGGFGQSPIEIHQKRAGLGESIYVIGTPLDESLDFSISRGIISANRDIKGQRYYQTDAAVNPGNSGGPVFNDAGNVIGIIVSGHFTNDGASRNINYIIPINDALRVMGL